MTEKNYNPNQKEKKAMKKAEVSTKVKKEIIKDIEGSSVKFKKRVDTWANFILGFHREVGNGIFFDIMGRYGYNLTNSQFKKMEISYTDSTTGETTTSTSSLSPARAYDAAIYIGIGFSPRGHGY